MNRTTLFISLFCLAVLFAFSGSVAESQNINAITIYMGQKIPPYQSMAKEIQRELKKYSCRVISLEDDLKPEQPKSGEVVVTIGQDAYHKILSMKGSSPLVYTMVLFPERADETHSPDVMGVAMVPSPKQQLQILHQCVGIKSVTVFINPTLNKNFVSDFEKLAPPDIKFTFEKVLSEKDFLSRLDQDLPKCDAILLVPEPTVLTEQGLKKLVRRSYEQNIPIVGFAPMYLRLGAALSISVSENLTAKVVAKIIEGESSQYGDRTDGLFYSRLCELRVSKTAEERFQLKLDKTRFAELGCELKEDE